MEHWRDFWRVSCAQEVVRAKNMFSSKPETAAQRNLHYRAVMLTLAFSPGWTYAELCERAAEMWGAYQKATPGDPTASPCTWEADTKRALAHLRSKEVAAQPIRILTETQLLLRAYLAGVDVVDESDPLHSLTFT